MTLLKQPTEQTRAADALRAIRSLLVHVEADGASERRLAAAVDLASRFDARLIGVGAEALQPLGVGDPLGVLGADWMVELETILHDNLTRAESEFRTKAVGLDFEWLGLQAYPTDAVTRVSRGADLVIAGGAASRIGDDYRVAQTAELVLKCGRPVLVVPQHGARLRGEAVVVAWKDTREARRAVADAMPFLRAAEEVVVQEICPETEFGDAEVHTYAVVQHLKQHGVLARAKVTIAANEFVADELQATARGIDADLIVAGGYGHTRLGEWVFGGVTRRFLGESEQFLLLSH